jgi:hypothetical protein
MDWWEKKKERKKTPTLATSHTGLDRLPAVLGYTLVENWELTYVARS